MMGRLLRSADFERVLRTRSRAQSAHFALHHLGDRPSRALAPAAALASPVLSTGALHPLQYAVDDSPRSVAEPTALAAGAVWLGAVVPKRHAKRAVTRVLLKRQIRAVVGGRCATLPGGLWVIRLRAPFDRQQFISAASDRLRCSAREELEQLLTHTVSRLAGR